MLFRAILSPVNTYRRWVIERRRLIFRFWDGLQLRRVDPIVVARGLAAHPEFSESTHLPLCDAGDIDAIATTAGAVRDVFGVPPFADGGLAELECLAVLNDFQHWLFSLKKNTNTLPTSPPDTGGTQDETPPGDTSTTRPWSVVG
jgi:hypothetical protein